MVLKKVCDVACRLIRYLKNPESSFSDKCLRIQCCEESLQFQRFCFELHWALVITSILKNVFKAHLISRNLNRKIPILSQNSFERNIVLLLSTPSMRGQTCLLSKNSCRNISTEGSLKTGILCFGLQLQ